MTTPPGQLSAQQLAQAYYVAQSSLARRTANRVQVLWRELDRRDLTGSWQTLVGPRVVEAVAAGQLAAAAQADPYVASVAAADGASSDPAGPLNPGMFAGHAADGRALDTLLYLPVITTKQRIAAGQSEVDAMLSGLEQLLRMAATEVMDAGRTAAGASIAGNRTIQGYIRVVNPPACARCIVLAGKEYGWNKGFQRHPRCFPAGVVVSGPSAQAATRRWYEGELVVLTTASGQDLPTTGNHPVLTDRGWVPANLVQEGDYVVRGTLGQGAAPLVVPDERQVPARIEDLWRPSGMVPLLQMPTSTEDFHGDGGHGDVDVVLADCLLWHRLQSLFAQPLGELGLAFGVVSAALFSQQGAALEEFRALLGASDGFMGSGGLSGSRLGAHLGGSHLARLGHGADLDASLFEAAADDATTDAVAAAQAQLALASGVGGGDFGDGENLRPSRWDAPAGPFTVESASAYASRGKDLRLRLSGQVELDRVVKLRRTEWSGHVYNLTSSEGWYSANGLIVSNCDCVHMPATLIARGRHFPGTFDPEDYFHGLSRAEQDRIFTKAGARAIRDGADLTSVVNARRGMYTADAYGQKVRATYEGATRRGRFYRMELARTELRTGTRFARDRTEARRGLPRFQLRSPRLMPEEIYRLAEDRDEAIRMLRRFGYIG